MVAQFRSAEGLCPTQGDGACAQAALRTCPARHSYDSRLRSIGLRDCADLFALGRRGKFVPTWRRLPGRRDWARDAGPIARRSYGRGASRPPGQEWPRNHSRAPHLRTSRRGVNWNLQRTGKPMKATLNIAFFGSSLVSAYWNGAATYYRGIVRALHGRGHRVTFYEPDAYERQKHRDIADPDWAEVIVYPGDDARRAMEMVDRARGADVVVKAS